MWDPVWGCVTLFQTGFEYFWLAEHLLATDLVMEVGQVLGHKAVCTGYECARSRFGCYHFWTTFWSQVVSQTAASQKDQGFHPGFEVACAKRCHISVKFTRKLS